MKKVAIYVRVSTVNGGQNLENQTIPLKEYCEKRGWEIYKIYEEKESGAKDNRPVLRELMAQAKKRLFDCVVVFRFDRFARSSQMLINSLETFNSLGIDFVSYQESLDSSSPAGKALFTVISAFAEFERAIIQERVMAGLYRARMQGKVLGRPRVDIDKEEILKLKGEGMTTRAIGQRFGLSHTTINNYIHS